MRADIEERFQEYASAPLSWHPTEGGKEAFICFKDSLCTNISDDVDGVFDEVSNAMLSGSYYPHDAVTFYGRHMDENRPMAPGDRILQCAPLLGLKLWSMVEIYVAEKTNEYCRIGYVTTTRHHGRGIWTATLKREEGELVLCVEGIASPNSIWFWLGLPIARMTQLRARRRGIENMIAVARGL